MRAKAFNFTEASEFFKQAASWKPIFPGSTATGVLPPIAPNFIPMLFRRSNAGLLPLLRMPSFASCWALVILRPTTFPKR